MQISLLFDFAAISYPYGLKRCSYQLMHLVLIAQRLGYKPYSLVSSKHLKHHRFLNRISHTFVDKLIDTDIYISKSDSFYLDNKYEQVAKFKGYKICLCNSDRTFRERDGKHNSQTAHNVLNRCDLYVPVNFDALSDKILPSAHPIDPRMFLLFDGLGLYEDYLDDNVIAIRNAFDLKTDLIACFMGSKSPSQYRINTAYKFDNVDFRWDRLCSSHSYIKFISPYHGILDMRGNGGKSIRLVESALLGKTIISHKLQSDYNPKLSDNNSILYDYDNPVIIYDRDKWSRLSDCATTDYLSGWSLKSQFKLMVERSGLK